MKTITESDWKKAKRFHSKILGRACEKIFDDVELIYKNRSENIHKSYLELYTLINEKNHELSEMFDDLRRSNIIIKITSWKRNNLISDEEFSEFSSETQESVNYIINL